MDKLAITSAIFLKLVNDFHFEDNADSMRLNMLAMEIAHNDHSLITLKNTIAFATVFTNFNLDDKYLQELIDMSKELNTVVAV